MILSGDPPVSENLLNVSSDPFSPVIAAGEWFFSEMPNLLFNARESL